MKVHALRFLDRPRSLSLPLTLFSKMPAQGGDRDIQAIRREQFLEVLVGEVLFLADLRDFVAHGAQKRGIGDVALALRSGEQPLLQPLLLLFEIHARKIL